MAGASCSDFDDDAPGSVVGGFGRHGRFTKLLFWFVAGEAGALGVVMVLETRQRRCTFCATSCWN
jgi:hypothetical protein